MSILHLEEKAWEQHKHNQNTIVSDKANKISFEIDVKLENYSKAMLVEVKTKPTTEDVKDHVKRLEKMRKFADLHSDKRAFLGAVAGVVITDNVRKYILKQGLFVIEPHDSEGFNITSPNGQPKEW
jgi:Holliday junction resolvase-like predicted endonuclease